MSLNVLIQHFKDIYNMVIQHSQETAVLIQITTAFLGAIIGGWTGTIQVFMILVGLDYMAGWLRAAKNGVLNSTAGYRGIVKKLGYFIVIAMFFQVGQWIGTTNADAMFVRAMVVNLFIMNELVSILENIRHLADEEQNYLPHGVVELLETLIADDIRQKLKLNGLPKDPENQA